MLLRSTGPAYVFMNPHGGKRTWFTNSETVIGEDFDRHQASLEWVIECC